MLLSQQMYRALGIGIPLVTAIVLLGLIDGTMNLFNTGLTPNLILGVGCLGVALALYKNRI